MNQEQADRIEQKLDELLSIFRTRPPGEVRRKAALRERLAYRGKVTSGVFCDGCADWEQTAWEAKQEVTALKAEVDKLRKHEAVCHCGVASSHHGNWDGHSFVEMVHDCPFEQRMKELEQKLKSSEEIRTAEKKILIQEIEKNTALKKRLNNIKKNK